MNVSIHLCEFLVVFCHVLVEDPYGVIVHDGVGKVHMRNIDFGGLQNIQAFAGIWVPDTQSIIIRLADNVYIVGLNFALNEFDLWWLLKRKQREQKADGRVFFYEQPDPASLSQKMLRAHGAILPDVGAKKGDFDDFYKKAFEDIAARIRSNGTLAACDEGNV